MIMDMLLKILLKDFGIKNLIYKNKKDTRKNLVAKQLLPDENY